MRKLIALTLLANFVILQPTYCGAQSDTVCVPHVVYKEILKLAETGVSLEIENEALVEQLDRDAKRTIEMQDELNKSYKKRKLLRFAAFAGLCVAIIEGFWLLVILN